jgi:hypothetical protein
VHCEDGTRHIFTMHEVELASKQFIAKCISSRKTRDPTLGLSNSNGGYFLLNNL